MLMVLLKQLGADAKGRVNVCSSLIIGTDVYPTNKSPPYLYSIYVPRRRFFAPAANDTLYKILIINYL